MQTLNYDPIITAADAQEIFDFQDEDLLPQVINLLSAKARAFFGRVQINEDLATAIVENIRGESSPTIYLHAPVHTADFSTYPLTVKVYSGGVLSTTYTANDSDVIVTSDDYSARVDLVGGYFPHTCGASWIEVEYFGGWATIPGDVYAGAIMQGKIDIKRLSGEVGLISHSANGQSVSVDQGGIVSEVAAMWQPYRMLI